MTIAIQIDAKNYKKDIKLDYAAIEDDMDCFPQFPKFTRKNWKKIT